VIVRLRAIGHALPSRALHSELVTELSSRFSSRDEFSRVETRRVERHFFVIFVHYFFVFSDSSNPNFRDFSRKLGSERVRTSRDEFSRVGTSSEKARKTRSDPNF
jgi:hypothetical protein